MKIDLSKFVEIKENDYIITSARYIKDANELKLTIESKSDNLDESLRKDLIDFFSYVNLKIEFISTNLDDIEELPTDDIKENLNNEEKIGHEEKEQVIKNLDDENLYNDGHTLNSLIKKKEEEIQARMNHAIDNSKKEEKKLKNQ